MNRRSNLSFRKRPVWLISFVTLFMLVLAACQPAAPAAAPTAAPTSTTAPTEMAAPTATTAVTATAAASGSGAEPVISVATDPKLGKILVDAKGMTLYMFKKDTADKSNCTAGCLKAWPPLTTTGSAKAGDGVDQSLIGTAAMPDGSKIVTYNHMPLYYYVKDSKPGDVTGQKVGEVWFVVAPDGKVVESDSSVPATGNDTSSADVTINVATDAKLGKILVDAKGMALYMFGKDTADKSNCTEGCLKAWPPLLTKSSAKAGEGVDQSLIGSATMADGSKIVTYNHMPLYYYVKDTKPGDVTGQNVGEVWFVVAPDGKPVGMSGASSSGSSSTAEGDVSINVATDAKLGKFLVDSKGMALYMFKKDTADKSNCTAGCLKAWPPLLTKSSAKAGDGVDQSLIGTAAMPDGSKIVTYNHMPLYYYVKDTKAGDVTGQNVGDVWYVVAPDGKTIEIEPSTSSDTSPAAGDVMVNVATDAKLGKILVDGKGMVLYMFTKDTPDKSNCTAGCLKAWPPLLTKDKASAGTGVDASMLGTASLADGSKIVTYNHMPLYYWVGDKQPGETTGQANNNVWWVVAPDGKPVGQTP